MMEWKKIFIRSSFRPNPGYVPPTYESRVSQPAGTILIDSNRTAPANLGQPHNQVIFGFGLLGELTADTEF